MVIKHTVTFELKNDISSAQRIEFFKEVDNLANIPGVRKFEVLKRNDKVNQSAYGIFMEFENKKIYNEYNENPIHVKFIQNYWLIYVNEFHEMDLEYL